MFDVRYKGLRIEVTLAAGRESVSENIDLNDVVEILEDGYDCGTGKRKEGIVEQCLRKGNKVLKAVVAQTSVRYPDGFQEDVWRLIHVGKFTYSKKHKRKGDENEA
ncbi:hypothetical protein HYU40_02285 [Candidatus Woesearchaeota archaeon]|nr:hypothetical protein [Candidatus Woesearchaeota archaeon]